MLPAAPPEGVSVFVPAQRRARSEVPPTDPAPSHTVLLALPPTATSATVLRWLRTEGIAAVAVHDGIAVLDAVRTGGPALLVLDVELPGPDRAAVLAAVHGEAPAVPVLAVTPRERRTAVIALLRAERDDYLLRPFAVDELAARIRLRLPSAQGTGQTLLTRGEFTVDTAFGELSVEGRAVALSPTEFAVFATLIDEAGSIVSAERIAERVWSESAPVNLVQVYISYLRRKIGAERIRTVRGGGYVLEV